MGFIMRPSATSWKFIEVIRWSNDFNELDEGAYFYKRVDADDFRVL